MINGLVLILNDKKEYVEKYILKSKLLALLEA